LSVKFGCLAVLCLLQEVSLSFQGRILVLDILGFII
jgi:hypothetical protein